MSRSIRLCRRVLLVAPLSVVVSGCAEPAQRVVAPVPGGTWDLVLPIAAADPAGEPAPELARRDAGLARADAGLPMGYWPEAPTPSLAARRTIVIPRSETSTVVFRKRYTPYGERWGRGH